MLRRDASGVILERLDFEPGAVRHLTVGPGSDWITLVLPLGLGKSADLVQARSGAVELEARCTASGLAVTIRRSDGLPRTLPTVALADLEAYDLRVNVRSGSGPGQVFSVRGGRDIADGEGPVLDLLGGRIPLAAGDYSITLETSPTERSRKVEGQARLYFDGEHHFVRGGVTGGGVGWWVVDLGAGRSVVARPALAPEAVVTRPLATEFSGAGAHAVDAEMLGLGGAVSTFQGLAEVAGLRFGDLEFDRAEVNVVATLPTVGGRPVLGILGLDLLGRAAVARLSYRQEGELWLGGSSIVAADRMPFTLADRHIFLAATLGGSDQKVTLVLDSGAKVSLLEPALATRLGLVGDPAQAIEIRGLGSEPVIAPRAEVGGMTLGGQRFENVAFHLAPLPVLASLGLGTEAAVLGNDFLRRFATVEINFESRTLALLPPADSD